MLLIDGVKYELWTPPSEDDFERVVKEHTEEIFGEQSIYLDRKQKLKSLSGVGSIPDGYVIIYGGSFEWHIVEVELSSYPLHDHIISQVGRFISGISNPNIQRGIVNAIDEEIAKDNFLKLRLRKAIEPTEIYRFLSDLISKQLLLTIIIEKDTEELREALNTLRYPQIKVIEFKTLARVGVGLPVHAHLFEPLYPKVLVPPRPDQLPPSAQGTLEIIIRNPSFIKFGFFSIPQGRRSFFPGFKIPFELETDVGEIETHITSDRADAQIGDSSAGKIVQGNLRPWYRHHPELTAGDKVKFTVIEPMRKYRLEIVKY